jgi:hypothetical protein
MNAALLGTIACITWNHIETHREQWERDQQLRRICEVPGFIPADIRCLIVKFVKENPPSLIAAVAYQESRFKTNALSPAGAHGVMQFMPATARAYNVNTHDALSSIVGGDRLLADLRRQFGNEGMALAAYNCGAGCVTSWLKGKRTLPKETRDYVKAITGHTVEVWRGKATMPVAGHRKAMERHLTLAGLPVPPTP